MNWRIVVAVIVAFVVGGAAGGLAERERVSNDRSSATTRTTAATADWFGNKQASACPALKRWGVAAGAAYKALGSKGPWTATRTTATKPTAAIAAAFRAMLPAANAAGKVELQLLIAYQNRLSAALKAAPSKAAFSKSRGKLFSARLKRDVRIVSQAAQRCRKT